MGRRRAKSVAWLNSSSAPVKHSEDKSLWCDLFRWCHLGCVSAPLGL